MKQKLPTALHNMTHTASPSIDIHQQNLSQVLQALKSSLYILYLHYQPYITMYEGYIKLFLLLVMIFVFYKLGKMSVSDKVLSQKQKLKSLIDKRNSVKDQVPKRISSIHKTNLRIVVVIILSAVVYAYAHYQGYSKDLQDIQKPLIAIFALILVYFIYTNVSKIILSNRLKQVNKIQNFITRNLDEFSVSLGPKVMNLLQNHLCRSIKTKYYTSKSINQCQKHNCKQIRALLKQRNDSIALLTEETFDFEWCSICKKRHAFDEYLPFEPRVYKEIETQNEEQEMKNKLGYLVDGLQRMRRWVGQVSPCNCSKLYWTTLTRQIIEYKKQQKTIQAKLKFIQQKKHRQLK